MKLLGITGSLRKGSYNTALLTTAMGLLPDGVAFELVHPDLPLYNADLDGDDKPAAVVKFMGHVESADALLLASPEYNYGIPGGLKNAIDWASRPAFESPLVAKPTGILSASMSTIGGARAQAALKIVLAGTLTPVYPAIEYLLGSAHEKFDENGRLIDATAERRLKRYLHGFVDWARKQDASQEK